LGAGEKKARQIQDKDLHGSFLAQVARLARILLREKAGTLTERDVALAHRLATDPAVENRLIDQSLASIRTEKIGR